MRLRIGIVAFYSVSLDTPNTSLWIRCWLFTGWQTGLEKTMLGSKFNLVLSRLLPLLLWAPSCLVGPFWNQTLWLWGIRPTDSCHRKLLRPKATCSWVLQGFVALLQWLSHTSFSENMRGTANGSASVGILNTILVSHGEDDSTEISVTRNHALWPKSYGSLSLHREKWPKKSNWACPSCSLPNLHT